MIKNLNLPNKLSIITFAFLMPALFIPHITYAMDTKTEKKVALPAKKKKLFHWTKKELGLLQKLCTQKYDNQYTDTEICKMMQTEMGCRKYTLNAINKQKTNLGLTQKNPNQAPPQKWSEKEKALLKQCVQRKMKGKKIIEELNMQFPHKRQQYTPSMIKGQKKALSLQKKTQKYVEKNFTVRWNADETNELIKLYNEGKKNSEIKTIMSEKYDYRSYVNGQVIENKIMSLKKDGRLFRRPTSTKLL